MDRGPGLGEGYLAPDERSPLDGMRNGRLVWVKLDDNPRGAHRLAEVEPWDVGLSPPRPRPSA